MDLAVAQPTAIALGEQKGGINLDEAHQSLVYGALLGGVRMPTVGPELAMPGAAATSLDDLGLLIKGDGERNAWPRCKRRGAVKPKYGADLAGDEGKGTPKSHSHTLEKHVRVDTRDLRARLRAEPKRKTVSRYIDEESAQRFTEAVVLKRQKQIDDWLNSPKQSPREPFKVADLGEHTGLSLSRHNFCNGLPPE
ncbi:MAG: hypothetical protein HOY79_47340 [Streptomyces sp.]|nr:hypothetical protein [Streptomyces sp.]